MASADLAPINTLIANSNLIVRRQCGTMRLEPTSKTPPLNIRRSSNADETEEEAKTENLQHKMTEQEEPLDFSAKKSNVKNGVLDSPRLTRSVNETSCKTSEESREVKTEIVSNCNGGYHGNDQRNSVYVVDGGCKNYPNIRLTSIIDMTHPTPASHNVTLSQNVTLDGAESKLVKVPINGFDLSVETDKIGNGGGGAFKEILDRHPSVLHHRRGMSNGLCPSQPSRPEVAGDQLLTPSVNGAESRFPRPFKAYNPRQSSFIPFNSYYGFPIDQFLNSTPTSVMMDPVMTAARNIPMPDDNGEAFALFRRQIAEIQHRQQFLLQQQQNSVQHQQDLYNYVRKAPFHKEAVSPNTLSPRNVAQRPAFPSDYWSSTSGNHTTDHSSPNNVSGGGVRSRLGVSPTTSFGGSSASSSPTHFMNSPPPHDILNLSKPLMASRLISNKTSTVTSNSDIASPPSSNDSFSRLNDPQSSSAPNADSISTLLRSTSVQYGGHGVMRNMAPATSSGNSTPTLIMADSMVNGSCKKRGRSLPDELKDDAYWERRRKNNEAAKRSRDARRAKEDEIAIRAAYLEQENLKLRVELASLKSETKRLRLQL